MSAPYELPALSVTWAMPDPPMPARDFYSWPLVAFQKATDLETKLGWAAGSLHVLAEAFRLQLSRKNGWDISGPPQSEPFQTAARVFRRGVALKNQAIGSKQGQYPIRFLRDLDWQDLAPDHQLCIIDQEVADLYHLHPKPNRIFIRLNELTKNLESVADLVHAARRNPFKTAWTIIGGGIVADTAAFAAALEGQSFRLVPTTLLAMVDACVGGKTGVNFPPYGKNQIGLFAFPEEVVIATGWLKTLPPREFLAGLAEAWKHAVLKGDAQLATQVAGLDRRPEDLYLHLRPLVAVKAEVVAKDPTEQGLRASLNLGHTLAHAIERISQDKNPQNPILHGEAVGLGLLFCIELSHLLGHLKQTAWQSMRQQLLQSRIVISPDQLRVFIRTDDLQDIHLIEEILIGIKQDKKNMSQDGSEWVLLKDWGQIVTDQNRHTIVVSDQDWIRCYKEFIVQWLKS